MKNKYVIYKDRPFEGTVLAILNNNNRTTYSNKTVSELAQEQGEELLTVSKEEINRLVEEDYKLRQGRWVKITEDQYNQALNELPPLKWRHIATGVNVFFCSEAYTGILHQAYIAYNGNYYTALRNVHRSNKELHEDFLSQFPEEIITKKKPGIIIRLSGGIVQEVVHNLGPDLSVDVVDEDIDGVGEDGLVNLIDPDDLSTNGSGKEFYLYEGDVSVSDEQKYNYLRQQIDGAKDI